MTDFLDQLLKGVNPQKRKRPVDLEQLSRQVVDNDRWDRREFDKIIKSQKEVLVARQKLAETIAGELGYDMGPDFFWMLWKARPDLFPDPQIRPTRLLNKRVAEEAAQLQSYLATRRWTIGDPIASALGFEKMEPELEPLYDKLQDQIKQQEEYQAAEQEAQQARADAQTAEEILAQWLEENQPPPEEGEEGEGEGEEEGEPGGGTPVPGQGTPVPGQGQGTPIPGGLTPDQLQQAVQEAQQNANSAEAQAAALKAELEAALDGMSGEIREQLEHAFQEANDYLETINNMAAAWGTEAGSLMRLPAAKRIELARRLDNPKFKRMSQLIGPFSREALAEQKRKVVVIPEEIVDLTLGDDIPRVIATELARFDMEETEMLFLKDLAEKQLVQYEMKGFEKIARGGIIYCHDGSGSMSGEREIWAKAIGLALLHVAKKQRRSFYGIQFGSAREIRIDDFRDTKKITPEKVIDFAEYFFNGGTDFMAPLKHALTILEREHAEFGAVQADIVFATDGCAPIADQFMKDLKEKQRKLDFKVWGIQIGAGGRDETATEPMRTLCEGSGIATINSLLNAHDVREIFRKV